jgi:predicted Zn-dependent protease
MRHQDRNRRLREASCLMVATLILALAHIPEARAQSPFDDLGGSLGDAVGGLVPSLPDPLGRASSAVGIATSAVDLLSEESQEEEIAVGRSTAARFLGATKLVEDPRVQSYVSSVGLSVAGRGERPALPWKFAVVETGAINAFALPGGIVLVTSGLYQLLQSEDELAAVLGHEIAHVQRQHHFRVIKQQKMVGAISGAVMEEIGSTQDVVATLAARATEVMARGLDKDAEYEADRDGMVLAARAGYDSSALFTVLERIQAASEQGGDTSFIFSTHPSPGARIAELSRNIPPLVETSAIPSPAARRILAYALPR